LDVEYFFRFASEGLREGAAAQAAEWLKFLRDIFARQNDYEKRARALINWVKTNKNEWEDYKFGETVEQANEAFHSLRNFVTSDKPPKEAEKLDLEALFAEIQTTLKVNNLAPYVPPADCSPERLADFMDSMQQAQHEFGVRVRQNLFRFIEKKEDKSADEVVRQIRASYDSFDKDKNGTLTPIEFEAACMQMGVVSKDQAAKDALFNKLSEGQPGITFDQYLRWMKSRMVVSKDDPDSVRGAFSTMADGKQGLSDADLHLLSEEDQEFVKEHFRKKDGLYDHVRFVTETMGR